MRAVGASCGAAVLKKKTQKKKRKSSFSVRFPYEAAQKSRTSRFGF
jgi:hypothetical protein